MGDINEEKSIILGFANTKPEIEYTKPEIKYTKPEITNNQPKITRVSTLNQLKSILNDVSTKKILNNTKLDNENLYGILNINLVSEIVNNDEVNVPRNRKMCKLNNNEKQCNQSSIGCEWKDTMCSKIKTNVDNQLTGVKADSLCTLLTVNKKCDINYNLNKNKIQELSEFEKHREGVLVKLTKITEDDNVNDTIKNNINGIINIINNNICAPLEYLDKNDYKCKPLISKCINNDIVKKKLNEKNCVNINTTVDNSLEEINKNIVPKICNERNIEKCIKTNTNIDNCIIGKNRNNNKVCIPKNCYKRNVNNCFQESKDKDEICVIQNFNNLKNTVCTPKCSLIIDETTCNNTGLCTFKEGNCIEAKCNKHDEKETDCTSNSKCLYYEDTDKNIKKCIPNCEFTQGEFNTIMNNNCSNEVLNKLKGCKNKFEINENINIYDTLLQKCSNSNS